MSVSSEYIEFIRSLSPDHWEISDGKFFGGHGFKSSSVQFAIIMKNVLYFCVDDSTRGKYIEKQMEPFSYKTKSKTVIVKKYYAVPAEVMDDPFQFLEWGQEAIEAAHRGKK